MDSCLEKFKKPKVSVLRPFPRCLQIVIVTGLGTYQSTRSTSGNTILYPGRFVCKRFFKQWYVASSSTAWKYIGLLECIQKVWNHRCILKEDGEGLEENVIHEDNQACLSCAIEEAMWNKHVDARYNIRREAIGSGEVKSEYCVSTYMTASTLRKLFGPQKFKRITKLMPMVFSFTENADWWMISFWRGRVLGCRLNHICLIDHSTTFVMK